MAEDLAREIIAQSGSGSKLAFSFEHDDGYEDMLLYTSRDAGEKTLYHLHQPRYNETYEFKYTDLESAVDAIRTFNSRPYISVVLVLRNNGINCEEVQDMGKVGRSHLAGFLQNRVKVLDAVNFTKT